MSMATTNPAATEASGIAGTNTASTRGVADNAHPASLKTVTRQDLSRLSTGNTSLLTGPARPACQAAGRDPQMEVREEHGARSEG